LKVSLFVEIVLDQMKFENNSQIMYQITGCIGIRNIRSVLSSESDPKKDIEKNLEYNTEKDKDTHASLYQESLSMYRRLGDVLGITSKVHLRTSHDLSVVYTPGVAEPCKKISTNSDMAYIYTMTKNTVAIVTDGSSVLGLGNIGPYAALPVMEGKAIIFKEFANINAFPICLDTQDIEEVIKAGQVPLPRLRRH
jgi:malate dehydrogenase (oxaloacetate-decarboxylating)